MTPCANCGRIHLRNPTCGGPTGPRISPIMTIEGEQVFSVTNCNRWPHGVSPNRPDFV